MTAKPIPNQGTITLFRHMALWGYLGLLIFIALTQLVYASASEFSLTFRVLFWIVPLLLPLLGIIRGKPYTHAWANFILMWYFLHSLTLLYVDFEHWYLAVIELLLTTIAFIGCTGYARNQGRALGLGLKKLKDQD
jgi:uncharacterized membrane protein